ncbi:17763_t:CDS:2, partial [Gigaspora rosea]
YRELRRIKQLRGLSQIKSVIKKYHAEVNCKNQNGKTALHWAAKNGYTIIIEALLKNKARVDESDNNANVNHINKNGEIALHKAAYHGYQEIVQILLEKNANIKAVSDNGWTTLHFAAAAGHVEVIKILLECNGNLNTASEYSKTALYCAAENKHTETVKYLLEVEARNDQDFNEQYFYPIYFAAKKKYENVVKLLSEKTYHIKLHYTAGKEDIEIVKFLLNIETKYFIIDKNGRTPLHWAAFEGYEEMVKNLVEKGTNLVEFMDNYKETALYQAVWNGRMNIVKFLYDQGAKINHKNINDWNPLHLAAISCQVEVFKFLKNKEVDFQLSEFFEQLDVLQLNNPKFENFYNSDFTKNLIERFRNFDDQFKLEDKLIENISEDKQKLEEVQSELKKKLVLRQTLGILKIVAQTISAVGGPIGIASDIIKGGVNIVEAFISEDNKNKPNFEISPDIKNSLKNMEEMVKSEENEIMIAKQQLKKLSYELKEIKDELVQTQTKLEDLKKNATDQKTNIELRVLNDLNIAIETTEKVIELYDRYQKDKEKLDALSNSIKQANEDIKKLKQFEENINKAIKISKGFNIQEDTIRYMEKLDEGITTLINIYNHIQDYYDQ